MRKIILFVVCLLCAGSAQALSLGELRVVSGVGRPFEAVLPFTTTPGEEINAQCVRLPRDAPSPDEHVPSLTGTAVTVESTASGGRIVVRTRAIVNEPAVRLRIAIECARTSLSREYVLLLDAPGVEPPTMASIAAPAAGEAGPAPPTPRVSRRSERRLQNDSSLGSTSGVPPAVAGEPRPNAPSPQREARPATRENVQRRAQAMPARGGFRLSLSRPTDPLPPEPPFAGLKRSDELSLTPPVARSAPELEALRLEARIRLAEDPVAEAAKLKERLDALEANMTTLRTQLATADAARLAAEDRVRTLAEEKRRLVALRDSAIVALVLLACAALLVAYLWRTRKAAEARGARARAWTAEGPVATADAVAPPAPSPTPAPLPVAPRMPDPARTIAIPPRAAPRAPVDPPEPAGTVSAPPTRPPTSPAARAPVAVAFDAPTADAGSTDEEVDFFLPPTADAKPLAAVPAAAPMQSPARQVEAAPRYPTQRLPVLSPTGGAVAPRDVSAAAPRVVSFAGPGAVADDAAARRAADYLAEFERRLFPEVATGKVKLDDARSIIVLARTYYQEDFDAAKSIALLEYALARASEPQRIHLALLEVLRMERRAGEYLVSALAFRNRYPDSATHWQLIAAYGRLLDARETAFAGAPVPGLDLDTPSNWLGSTLDMTKYVLGQKVAASLRDVPELTAGVPA